MTQVGQTAEWMDEIFEGLASTELPTEDKIRLVRSILHIAWMDGYTAGYADSRHDRGRLTGDAGLCLAAISALVDRDGSLRSMDVSPDGKAAVVPPEGALPEM